MRRRAFVGSLAAAAATWSTAAPGQGDPVVAGHLALRERLIGRARDLAAARYRNDAPPVPEELARLGYDAYRRIENHHNLNVWRDGPGGVEIAPLPRGFIYSDRMRLHVVEDGRARELAWDDALFDFRDVERPVPPEELGEDIGYSGARLLARINDPAIASEFLVFQGASYFRALASGLTFGLSARGLAVRTADPEGEEFPAFTDLWIEQPPPGAGEVICHALLDGPSVTGAFLFTIRPGTVGRQETRIGVNATIFAREDLDHIGLAPLTSMYWYGPLERGAWDDYRPRVHDSDGLSICTEGGEWIWRPLANPGRLQVSAFDAGARPVGFGLAQRARDWHDFEDTDAGYETRPGAWIAPHADWPAGRVALVEIPTDSEFNDNIVAYWRPEAAIPAGGRLDYGYDMVVRGDIRTGYGLLGVEGSRSGAYARTWRQIVVDFGRPGTVVADPSALTPNVTATGGRIEAVTLAVHDSDDSLRMTFMLVPETDVCEIRAVIEEAGRPISETWLYRWTAS